MTASEARKRLEYFRNKARKDEHKKVADKMTTKERAAHQEAKTTFDSAISSAFEVSLRYYVDEEERELMSHLQTCLQEERDNSWRPAEEDIGIRVLGSANKLFFRIRASLTRCLRMISRGHSLLALSAVFQKSAGFQKVMRLHAIALMLRLLKTVNEYNGHTRLPKTVNGHTHGAPPYTGSEWHIKLPEEEERVTCHILHTAEFCRETGEALAAAIKKDIRPQYSHQVDFSEEESSFVNVSSSCISVLVLGINTRWDVALVEMSRVHWDDVEQPGDDSVFVNTIRKVVKDCAPRLGQLLDRASFSFLCDKMARMFITRFSETVVHIRRISEKGGLQLSIDCDSVKRILTEFPKAAYPLDPDVDFSSYTHYVEREMGAVINMVKVIQAKPENLVDTFMLLMPQQLQNQTELVRVCEMKGVSRALQQSLLHDHHQRSGGDASSAPSTSLLATAVIGTANVASSAATSLGAFKDNFTHLASSFNFPGKHGTSGTELADPATPSTGPAMKAVLAASMFSRLGSVRDSTQSGPSITDAVKEKTKEGFAKIGRLFGNDV
eukprot:gene13814-19730_t